MHTVTVDASAYHTVNKELIISIAQTQQARDLKIALPSFATQGSAGMDLQAVIPEPLQIAPSSIVVIPTGIIIALPTGYEAQIRSRSGLAAKYGIFCLNAPGTVDSDYRGEVQVILANFSSNPFTVHCGDRIAQMVIARYELVKWRYVDVVDLKTTERGAGGFGSTGV
jgi:dUTP pyrophosphatase